MQISQHLLPVDQTVQTCIAGESTVIKAIRDEIFKVRGMKKDDAYVSGYWKVGMIEDEHQTYKQTMHA